MDFQNVPVISSDYSLLWLACFQYDYELPHLADIQLWAKLLLIK